MTVSYAFLIICGLFFLLLGYLIGNLWGARKSRALKPRLNSLEKENQSLQKAVKKEKNQVDQLRKKSESWKHEYHALTQDHQLKTKDLKSQITELNEMLKSNRTAQSKISNEKEKLQIALERLQKEQEKLKEKYKRDVSDGKDWINERTKLEREVKDLTSRLERQTATATDYRKKYDQQAEEINKIRVMERELRLGKTKISALTKDVAYWEKMHYDTHHELAELKTKMEEATGKFAELDQLRKGDEILMKNLKEQIAEFKTKFVDVNNKYRQMMNSN